MPIVDFTRPIILVACCGLKLDRPAPAADLYTSDLFRKSRAYAERFGHAWYILSAKHGILSPDKVISPYDDTLRGKSARERASWNRMVLAQWGCGHRHPVVILAGNDYRGWVGEAAGAFQTPMEGMRIGQQKAWLKAQLAAPQLAAA